MNTNIKALIVEDSSEDALLLVNELQSAGFDPKWTRVETETDYCAGLATRPDIIFSDFTLPRFSTPRALALLNESRKDIPFVVVSGTIGEERAVECLKSGATDYVCKDHIHRLGPVVQRALREAEARAEQARLETELLHAQKMECVGQLAGGVAHDFNNVLAIIRCSTDLVLMNSGSLSAKEQEHLKEVLFAADRASALVQQLLAFSHKQVMQFQPLKLNEVLQRMAKMIECSLSRNIALNIRLDLPLAEIHADVSMMEQVLMNLAINSRDAMPHGGELNIRTSDEIIGTDCAELPNESQPGHYVCLEVADTGCGIPPEIMPHIFEPFFTTKPVGKGTGLGLSTVHGIIHQHHGWIKVQSEIGKGTTFRIYIPALPSNEEHATGCAEARLSGGTETVLLVEADAMIRGQTHEALKDLGYTVIESDSGYAALETWRKCGGHFDLILTNLALPGFSGLELGQRLRAENPSVPIVYTSSYGAEIEGKDLELQEGVNFLRKPYPPEKLAQLLRAALNDETADTHSASNGRSVRRLIL